MKQLLLLVLAVFLTSMVFAQNTSNSPYSRFGIGDLQTVQNPRNMAIGGLSVGLTGARDVSVHNPASYMNLDSLSVHFDISVQLTLSRLHEQQEDVNVTANTNSASLGQISFAFPITHWWKSCFGLTPNSNMSYNVTTEFSGDPNLGRYYQNYNGHGGLNQVFLGFALGTNRVAVGANVNYHFGSFTRNTLLSFSDTVLRYPSQTSHSKHIEANGVSFDLGIQYTQPLSSRYQLGFGLRYTPHYALNASRYIESFSITPGGIGDSILPFAPSESGTLRLPDRYTAGLSFERLGRWVLGAEYTMVNFKNYREFSENPNFGQAYTFRVGGELKGRRLDNNFLNRLNYRAGYHYGSKNYVIFQDEEIKQFGVSFGVGIPIRRSFSRVDIAMEFGRKGRASEGQIQENYGRIVLGISAFDQWFIRGKFD